MSYPKYRDTRDALLDEYYNKENIEGRRQLAIKNAAKKELQLISVKALQLAATNPLHLAIASFSDVHFFCQIDDEFLGYGIDDKNKNGHTALQSIFMPYSFEMSTKNLYSTCEAVKSLLEAGANPNLYTETFTSKLKKSRCYTLLEYAIFCFNDKKITELLLIHGASITEFIDENVDKMSFEIQDTLKTFKNNTMHNYGFKR